jgi:hypothetical protein
VRRCGRRAHRLRQAGHEVVTLQTLPGDADTLDGDEGKVGGFGT